MYGRFEYITDLQYKVKSLEAQVNAFQSGEKYQKMRLEYQKRLAAKDRDIKNLKQEVAAARTLAVTIREIWQQVIGDMEKEHAGELRKKDRCLKKMEERALSAERQRDDLKDKVKEKIAEIYAVKTELEEEKERNKKLLAQLNSNYENSSLPSSQFTKSGHKKIHNNREKTGRKPGGQPGHKGHGRKKQVPTRVILIPAPEKYTADPLYRATGRMLTRQTVNIGVNVFTDEYTTAEFRNILTGQRVHAEFPPDVRNDVNYGGSVKAFAFLLNTHCCVSIDKAREFMSEITDGALNISKGMISGLCKEFSKKTQEEQDKAFSELMLAPVMNTDCTGARVAGLGASVYVCATPTQAMYFAREHKGHEGVAKTPVQDYQGILVHDHDRTFYHYGTAHQECLAHILRYLKGSMENEPQLKWNSQMRELLKEMIHYRNGWAPGEKGDPEEVERLESEYERILNIAKDEYEYEPPGKYYKDGYNLYARLKEYMKSHLLFLHDTRVPSDNNLSERLLRVYKRKQKQVMTLRSFGSLDCLCRSMSMVTLLRSQNKNIYKSVAAIFD